MRPSVRSRLQFREALSPLHSLSIWFFSRWLVPLLRWVLRVPATEIEECQTAALALSLLFLLALAAAKVRGRSNQASANLASQISPFVVKTKGPEGGPPPSWLSVFVLAAGSRLLPGLLEVIMIANAERRACSSVQSLALVAAPVNTISIPIHNPPPTLLL